MARINWTEDELLLAAYWLAKNEYRYLDDTDPETIALSRILQGTSVFHPNQDRPDNFRSPNSVSLKFRNMLDTEVTGKAKSNGSKLDAPALKKFRTNPEVAKQQALRLLEVLSASNQGSFEPGKSLDEIALDEGGLLLVTHYRRERNPKLRAKKIASVLHSGGVIKCEVCDFNYEETYGERGAGYIEVHHILPLHVVGKSTTKLSDLALLCANCHRMIHNKKEWLTPNELKSLLKVRR